MLSRADAPTKRRNEVQQETS